MRNNKKYYVRNNTFSEFAGAWESILQKQSESKATAKQSQSKDPETKRPKDQKTQRPKGEIDETSS